MNRRVKKFGLLLLAAALLFGAGQIQHSLNRDRDTLGLTRTTVLENAPPALAFTTVALGGFRGLISNFLWIRANDLQQDDKFFEAAQLADWITKLEPTFTQVWLFQAWNMAYNISVKFKENSPGQYADRWHWVEHGIELLRDDGLRYNPNSILIYRELGWFFQHKMGQNLDDANMYYKKEWRDEMTPFFGPSGTNFDHLLHPRTAADFQLVQVLTNRYKIDPQFAKSVDDQYGPFDWRLPDAHAIYWGSKALDEAKKNPDKVKLDDLMTVRRIIFQSMQQAFMHGRVVSSPFSPLESLGANLDMMASVNRSYTNAWAEEADPGQKDGILKAHRNFLRTGIYFLYVAGRTREAQQWYNYMAEKYPDKAIVENQPDSLPRTLTLDEYALAVLQIDIGETSQDRVTSAIEGFLMQAYSSLAAGDEDRFTTLKLLAKRVHERYEAKTTGSNGEVRVALMPFNDMNQAIVHDLLDPNNGISYAARAQLVTRLNLPTAMLTNGVPGAVTELAPPGATNAPPTNGLPAVRSEPNFGDH
jgi:hypothetical protein